MAFADPTRIQSEAFIKRRVLSLTEDAFNISAQAAFRNAARRVADDVLPPLVRSMAEALDLRAVPSALLQRTNRELAEGAQAAMVAGFRSRLPRKSERYRGIGETPGKGRLVGHLEAALADPAHSASSSASVIRVLDPRIMNVVAEHWWRVNYGAGSIANEGFGAASFLATAETGQVLFALSDPSPPSGPNFLPGYVDSEGGVQPAFVWRGNQLWISHRTRGRRNRATGISVSRAGAIKAIFPSRGIRAARFTDLALESIASNFGPAYTEMYARYASDAANRVKLEGKGVTVPADVRL